MFDASPKGAGIIETQASVQEQRAEARWSSRGGWCVWVGGRVWEDSDDFNPDVPDGTAAGTRIRVPAVSGVWDPLDRWKETFRWKWEIQEHINLCELRTALAAVRHLVRSRFSHGKRTLLIGDSLVTIGAYSKGRSSSYLLNGVLRTYTGILVGFRLAFAYPCAETHSNPTDRPSRSATIPEPPPMDEDLREWIEIGRAREHGPAAFCRSSSLDSTSCPSTPRADTVPPPHPPALRTRLGF